MVDPCWQAIQRSKINESDFRWTHKGKSSKHGEFSCYLLQIVIKGDMFDPKIEVLTKLHAVKKIIKPTKVEKKKA